MSGSKLSSCTVSCTERMEGGPQEGAQAGIHVIVAVVELAHRPDGDGM